MADAMTVHDLVNEWEFKQTDLEEWMPVERVPTNVHLDLMANKKWGPYRIQPSISRADLGLQEFPTLFSGLTSSIVNGSQKSPGLTEPHCLLCLQR